MCLKMLAPQLKTFKGKRRFSMLTAYDYSMACILSRTDIDIILVGDSLGNVMLGFSTTIPVTLEHIIYHSKAVVRGASNKFIIADMPFMSTNVSLKQTLSNVKRVIQETGVHAVKMEGANEVVLESVRHLVDIGIPVMGHLGLTPQSYLGMGGYKMQGKSNKEADKLAQDAMRLQQAGVFSIVLECIPETLAQRITDELDVITIGIGAGRYTDGQVLVINDLLGLGFGHVPGFVKPKANLKENIIKAVCEFIKSC